MRAQSTVAVWLPTLALTAARVVLGIFWLLQWTWKLPPTFGCPNEGFCLWVSKEIEHPLIPLYGQVVSALVQPNIFVFGWITNLTETVIGVLLLLGIRTRLGGLLGTLWAINLLIGLRGIPGEPDWYYEFLVLLNAAFLGVGGAGQISLDRVLGLRGWWSGTEPSGEAAPPAMGRQPAPMPSARR